jgi:hypothetical protein
MNIDIIWFFLGMLMYPIFFIRWLRHCIDNKFIIVLSYFSLIFLTLGLAVKDYVEDREIDYMIILSFLSGAFLPFIGLLLYAYLSAKKSQDNT